MVKRLLRKVLSVCLITVITVVLLEAVLRISAFDRSLPLVGVGFRTVELGPFRPHPTRYWCLQPDYEQTEVNAQGFRGPAISKNKPSDRYRIVCLGNSCTFGTGCDYNQTYTAWLQKMFDKDPGQIRVEVINAGVPGYSTMQELRYLKEDILDYNPDMLIVQFGENDEEGGNDVNEFPSPIFFRWQPVLLKSKVFQAGYGLYFGIKKFRYYHDKEYQYEIRQRSYLNCIDNVKAIERYARENGIRLYFITPAWVEKGRLVRKTGFARKPAIDIYKALKDSGQKLSALYFDPHHWLPVGHFVVAEKIYKTVHQTVERDLQERDKGGSNPDFHEIFGLKPF